MTTVPAPGGGVLAVSEAGDPDGRPVVFHHGTPAGATLPPPAVADAERRGIRLIGFDRPGYGGSTRRPGRRVADTAADVGAIADALGLDRLACWGISGGGAPALACGALLADRVVAVASLAGVAPADADGLDWTAGMGEDNIEEYRLARRGEDALRAWMGPQAAGLTAGEPGALVEILSTLLSPVDAAVLTPDLAAHLLASSNAALAPGIDGWVDDDLSHIGPWGFDPADVAAPALIWHGAHDRFVPQAHGRWLAERIPGAEARLTDDDGHLTLVQRRIGDVHAWLLRHF